MKFVIDQQLPPAPTGWLQGRGHVATHVRAIGLRDADDALIWAHADAEGAAVITKDEDFAARRAVVQRGPTIIWQRIGNAATKELITWLEQAWPGVEAALQRGAPVIEVH